MLEIIIVWQIAKRIGNEAIQKGLKKGSYQVMAVLLWFIGEFTGAVLGGILFGPDAAFWIVYVFGLVGAVVGTGISFGIMKFLPTQDALESNVVVGGNNEPSGMQNFGRSVWVPILVILMAFLCLCIIFGAGILVQMMAMS